MKKAILLILILLISGCVSESDECYNDCLNPELVIANNCSINDNNCIGGNHYCYDLCYGGASLRGLKGLR